MSNEMKDCEQGRQKIGVFVTMRVKENRSRPSGVGTQMGLDFSFPALYRVGQDLCADLPVETNR